MCALSLDTGQNSHNKYMYFYNHNRRLMLASSCNLVQSLFHTLFLKFWAFEPAFLYYMYVGNNATRLYVPHLPFCKTHCSVAKYAPLMCSILLLFIAIFNLGWSGSLSLIWGPDYMRPVRTQTGMTSDQSPYNCLFLFTWSWSEKSSHAGCWTNTNDSDQSEVSVLRLTMKGTMKQMTKEKEELPACFI